MSEDDPIRRAARWKAFYEEPGGIRDMLGALRVERYKLMDDTLPWEVAKLANLAIGAQIAKRLEEMVNEIIASGKVAENAKEAADRIASIPEYRRRWAGAV